VTLRGTDHWGIATFSKYPIVGRGRLFYEEGHTNFGIFSDVVVRGDTVRVYNVHLQSNYFKEKDYKFIANPDSGGEKEMINGSKSILKRLKKAVIKRSEQVDELRIAINNCPYPFILCGDFNDPPFSYAYQKIREQLADCYLEKGSGFGVTYLGSFPPYRIDYILHSKSIRCDQYQTLNVKLSDHRPIVAWLSLKK
jgi:endonuclease/exonuclease/phosphatase family metal-dependent hydrolase